MSIEEIRNLVQQEKEAQQELKKAEEKAAAILEKAKEDARKILQEAEGEKYYEDFSKDETRGMEERKKRLEREINTEAEKIREKARKNLGKTVSLITKHVLEE